MQVRTTAMTLRGGEAAPGPCAWAAADCRALRMALLDMGTAAALKGVWILEQRGCEVVQGQAWCMHGDIAINPRYP